MALAALIGDHYCPMLLSKKWRFKASLSAAYFPFGGHEAGEQLNGTKRPLVRTDCGFVSFPRQLQTLPSQRPNA